MNRWEGGETGGYIEEKQESVEFKRSMDVCLNKQEGKVKEMSAGFFFFHQAGGMMKLD